MKYLPKNSVETIKKSLLYSNKPVYLDEGADRRPSNSDDVTKRTSVNLDYRLGELKDYIFKKNYYCIPLGVLVDLGLVNFATETNTEFLFTLQRNMNKLFEKKRKSYFNS